MFGWKPPEDDYTPADDGPEARMHRKQMEQQERDCNAVERLLASLKPEHATRRLIPWRLIKQWNLPHRKYPL